MMALAKSQKSLKSWTKQKWRTKSGKHWMKQKDGSLKLMKHDGKFVPHKGASLAANFAVQKKHNAKQK